MNYKLLHNMHQFDTTIQLITTESRLILMKVIKECEILLILLMCIRHKNGDNLANTSYM